MCAAMDDAAEALGDMIDREGDNNVVDMLEEVCMTRRNCDQDIIRQWAT